MNREGAKVFSKRKRTRGRIYVRAKLIFYTRKTIDPLSGKRAKLSGKRAFRLNVQGNFRLQNHFIQFCASRKVKLSERHIELNTYPPLSRYLRYNWW